MVEPGIHERGRSIIDFLRGRGSRAGDFGGMIGAVKVVVVVVVVVVFVLVGSVVLTGTTAGATGALAAGGVSGSASLMVTTVSFRATPRKGSILEPMLNDRSSSAAKSSVRGTLRSGRVGGTLVGEMGLVGELRKSMRLGRELQRPEVKRVDSLWVFAGLVGDLVALVGVVVVTTAGAVLVSICAGPLISSGRAVLPRAPKLIQLSRPVVWGMSSFSKPPGFGSAAESSFPLEVGAGVVLLEVVLVDVRPARDLPLLKGVLGLLGLSPSCSALVRPRLLVDDSGLFGESKAYSAIALLPCTVLAISIQAAVEGTVY